MGPIASRGFVFYVNCNMLFCSVVFLAWALPRETVSGLLGRWLTTEAGWKGKFAIPAVWLVDRLYWWEPDHCRSVYRMEEAARAALYPC